MNDSSLVKVVNSRHDLSHELSRFVFVKFLLLVDILHQFSTYALGIEKKSQSSMYHGIDKGYYISTYLSKALR